MIAGMNPRAIRSIQLALACLLMAVGACRSASTPLGPSPTETHVQGEDTAPSSDLMTGDQASGMASEDTTALRLRPATQPALRPPDVRQPRLHRRRGIGSG